MTSRQTKSLKNFRGALVLIGAGKMGGAMIEGWLSRGLNPRQLIVIEPQPSSKIRALARRGLRLNPRGKTVASAVVFAVKPQIAAQALEPLAEHVGKSTLVLSIMAGMDRKPTSILGTGAPATAPAAPGSTPLGSGSGGVLDQLRQQPAQPQAPAAPQSR